MTQLPTARGPLGERVFDALTSRRCSGTAQLKLTAERHPEDDALVLWVLHELHYRGFADVHDDWEWSPALGLVRWHLETELLGRLRSRFAAIETPEDDDVVTALRALIEAHQGPSLARHLQHRATRDQALELLRQRSIYHLKEADPTSWVIPRLSARPKAALMEVQLDEYGAGDPGRLHHHLFERGLAASGLDSTYGAYVDEVALPVLEQNNALSMFGLRRGLRGAALGHLAAFEATSSVPSRQLAQGLRRLRFPEAMAGYYDEHVEADAVHDQIAVHDICGSLVAEEPDLLPDVLLGAWTCLDLESRTAAHFLSRWQAPVSTPQ